MSYLILLNSEFLLFFAIFIFSNPSLSLSAGNNLLSNMQNKYETYRKSMNIALSNILNYSFYKI